MPGYSLHIGLDKVDPERYEGWNGKLEGCCKDARRMQALATHNDYEPLTITPLLNESATREKVISCIRLAIMKTEPGDIFLLSLSGHGGQLPDMNGDEKIDDTWCLFNGELIDDELFNLWGEFDYRVRILVISDSCHSGSIIKFNKFLSTGTLGRGMIKEAPDEILDKTRINNRGFYEDLRKQTKSKKSVEIKASVKLIGACQDNQKAYSDSEGGHFTNALLTTWDKGAFNGTYSDFHISIQKKLLDYQSPSLLDVGVASKSFNSSKPFKI